MRISDTLHIKYMQPVVLASVPRVGRAAPTRRGTRPVLQAAYKYFTDRAIPTGCQGAKRSGATPGTEVGIARNRNTKYFIHI